MTRLTLASTLTFFSAVWLGSFLGLAVGLHPDSAGLMALRFIGVYGVVAFWLAHSGVGPRSIGLSLNPSGPLIGAAIAAGLILPFTWSTLNVGSLGLGWIIARIIQAGAEEFLFRGWLYHRLKRIDPTGAVILSTGAFVSLHLTTNPHTVATLLIFSVAAIALTERWGLGAAWLFHAVYNLLNAASPPTALGWFVQMMGCVFIIILWRWTQSPPPPQKTEETLWSNLSPNQ